MPGPSGGTVELTGLRKVFGDEVAVDRLDLRIDSGEFFSLLGPSGCGKTTTLRMIAGFEAPTEGAIAIDGSDVAHVPAHRRRVNTVFQSYALFPHLSVAENVGYGLRWQSGVGRQERRQRVAEALDLVQLGSYAARRPHQLSGGQQQRVALARALVLRPSVLLLDEPLGALDAKLRKSLRQELITLHREVGVTFVFVTHDQEEALEMSDRLAVMDRGRVVQCGSPREVYESPTSEYVADFLGVANLLDVQCLETVAGGRRRVRLGEVELVATPVDERVNGVGRVVIRPECVRIQPGHDCGPNAVRGVVDRLVYVGATTQVVVRLPHGPAVHALVVNDRDQTTPASGAAVNVTLPPEALRLLAHS